MKKIPLPAALITALAAALAIAFVLPFSRPKPKESPEPVASLEKPAKSSFLDRLELPLKPAPTPRSERDEAIHQLSQQGHQPTAEALAGLLQNPETTPPIDLFIKAGVDPKATDAKGRPLLVIACGSDRSAEVFALLSAGADPNAADSSGITPLMAAAQAGATDLLPTLLFHGATLEATDPEGHGALHHAILAGQSATARLLIDSGAAITPCCDGSGSLSLHALKTKNETALATALELEKPTEWHPEFATALLEAARTGDRDLARLLIAHHESAPPHPESRHPLLGYAVAWGDHDLLRLLLECGADANTPLGSPVDPAFAELVPQKFIRHYLQREAGLTPLMLAAGRGDLAAVEALLDHGAKRNALTGKSRWPALSFAAQSKSVEVMQRLLGKTPAPDDQQTRIEISLGNQTAQLWRNNELSITTRISTGRSGYRTPTGRFVITDKTRNRVSTIYHVNMPYFMRLNCSAIGMHAGHVPGYPASHGCIRVPSGMAARLFREVPVGTLVIIR